MGGQIQHRDSAESQGDGGDGTGRLSKEKGPDWVRGILPSANWEEEGKQGEKEAEAGQAAERSGARDVMSQEPWSHPLWVSSENDLKVQ